MTMTSRPADSRVGAPGRIEPMRWWDIEPAAELERRLFPGDSPWTAAMFWSELAGGNRYRVWRGGDGVVGGYCGLGVGPDVADVLTVAVAPEAQGRGIGRALLGDLLRAAERLPVMLEVRCDNHAAIALYESEGFVRTGLRRHYYQPSGADAYTMTRPAGGPR